MPDTAVGNMMLCQSCGMPIAAAEHFGTNGDNTPSGEYCCFCFRQGRFTDNRSVTEKITESVAYHDEGEKELGRTLTRSELSVRLHVLYPTLRRWSSHENIHTAYYIAVNRALEYIQENLSGALNLKVLSEVSGLSGFHFHRIFRAVMGEAPGEYVQRLRLEKAAFMLSHSGHTIADIAHICGYDTQQALTRAFGRRFGVTPNAYRKSPVEVRFGVDESANLGIKPRITSRGTFQLSGIRAHDPLGNNKAFIDAWDRLRELTGTGCGQGEGKEFILLSRDRSTITRPENYDIYACISSPYKDRRLVKFTVEGGNFAVFTHRGPYSGLNAVYCHIYRWWLPFSGYRLRDTYYFERFPEPFPADGQPVTEIWIPIEKQ
ncbi:MAG: helix-turn-helix domain-containing protein [Alistipes sp.]|nr:helix-turn-helix domain-containing protein [Alistipes sp.]